MIEKGWCRSTINKAVVRVRTMFKWAVSKQLLEVSVYQTLCTVAGLCAGRTKTIDYEPVKPVPDALVNEVLPFLQLPIQAATMIMTYGVSFLASSAKRVPDSDQKPKGTPLLLPRHHPLLLVIARQAAASHSCGLLSGRDWIDS
jgi:hypothetical protein